MRCQAGREACTYPSPPDRKSLAAKRGPRRMSSKSQAPINSHDEQQEDLTWRSGEAPFSNLISSISTSTSVVIPPTPVASYVYGDILDSRSLQRNPPCRYQKCYISIRSRNNQFCLIFQYICPRIYVSYKLSL